MDKSQLMQKLNWFYSLELNQVELYTTQSKKVDDLYLSKVLERSAQIEQQHVDNIGEYIKELGSKPNLLGDVLGPILGKVGGQVSALAGVANMLKANILLEQKAMEDYKGLISKIDGNSKLCDLLWSNLIDEDLHTSWFAGKVKELEQLKH
jgi:bacterioferritin